MNPWMISLSKLGLAFGLLAALNACSGDDGADTSAAPAPVPAPAPAPPNQPSQSAKIPTGVWGGRGIRLEVKDDETVATFDCADGHIDTSFVADADGRFDLAGTVTVRRPGPIRHDPEPPNKFNSRYTGTVSGQTMSLNVFYQDEHEQHVSHDYTLELGRTPSLTPCVQPL